MVIAIVTLLFAVVMGFCYRVGGMSKAEAAQKIPWFPQVLVKGWFRDIPCTSLVLLWHMIFIGSAWWAYLASFLLMWGAFTTYWDEQKWINWDYPNDNFYLHGFFIALACFPMCIASGFWLGWVVRCIVLGVLVGLWSYANDDVDWEECGRGVLIALTLPLMLI